MDGLPFLRLLKPVAQMVHISQWLHTRTGLFLAIAIVVIFAVGCFMGSRKALSRLGPWDSITHDRKKWARAAAGVVLLLLAIALAALAKYLFYF